MRMLLRSMRIYLKDEKIEAFPRLYPHLQCSIQIALKFPLEQLARRAWSIKWRMGVPKRSISKCLRECAAHDQIFCGAYLWVRDAKLL